MHASGEHAGHTAYKQANKQLNNTTAIFTPNINTLEPSIKWNTPRASSSRDAGQQLFTWNSPPTWEGSKNTQQNKQQQQQLSITTASTSEGPPMEQAILEFAMKIYVSSITVTEKKALQDWCMFGMCRVGWGWGAASCPFCDKERYLTQPSLN